MSTQKVYDENLNMCLETLATPMTQTKRKNVLKKRKTVWHLLDPFWDNEFDQPKFLKTISKLFNKVIDKLWRNNSQKTNSHNSDLLRGISELFHNGFVEYYLLMSCFFQAKNPSTQCYPSKSQGHNSISSSRRGGTTCLHCSTKTIPCFPICTTLGVPRAKSIPWRWETKWRAWIRRTVQFRRRSSPPSRYF